VTLWNKLQQTHESGWTILIRLLVGLAVFLPEGIQKVVSPDILGAGRFAKIGIGAGPWSLDALLSLRTK
jgi:hypothetical protein